MNATEKSELTVLPYLALARDLSTLITPVAPDSHYRAALQADLVARARRQYAAPVLLRPDPVDASDGLPRRVARWVRSAPGQDRRWVWGAAAVGSAVSVASIAALVLRYRGRRAA